MDVTPSQFYERVLESCPLNLHVQSFDAVLGQGQNSGIDELPIAHDLDTLSLALNGIQQAPCGDVDANGSVVTS